MKVPKTPVKEITFKKADVGSGVTSRTEHEQPPRNGKGDGYMDYDSRFVTRVHPSTDDAAAHLVKSFGRLQNPGKGAVKSTKSAAPKSAASAIGGAMLKENC